MSEKFPIELDQVHFTRSVVVAIPGHTPANDAPTPGPENSIEATKIEGEPGRYLVTMRSRMNLEGATSLPYMIDMECIATLRANDSLSDEEALRGVLITGHSVTYGAIREAVAWITSRQPYGALMLGLSVLQPPSPPDTPKE